jgi:hypothetical protein
LLKAPITSLADVWERATIGFIPGQFVLLAGSCSMRPG